MKQVRLNSFCDGLQLVACSHDTDLCKLPFVLFSKTLSRNNIRMMIVSSYAKIKEKENIGIFSKTINTIEIFLFLLKIPLLC